MIWFFVVLVIIGAVFYFIGEFVERQHTQGEVKVLAEQISALNEQLRLSEAWKKTLTKDLNACARKRERLEAEVAEQRKAPPAGTDGAGN